MSEGSFKTKLLAAWAPLILVPPTGTQIRILLFLLLYTLATLDFHLSLFLSLFSVLPPSRHSSTTSRIYFYIYFNSVIGDITSLA